MLGSGISSSPVITDMFNQQSLSFNGTDESISLPAALAAKIATVTTTSTAEFTISCWVKIDTIGASGTIFKVMNSTNNQMILLYHASSEEFRFSCKFGGSNSVCNGGSTNAGGDSYEDDGIWHHLVGTVSATAPSQSLWIDGNEKEKITSAVPNLNEVFNQCSIGIAVNTGSAFWKGDLKDIAIYNRKLTDAEIGVIYNSGGRAGNKCIDLASGSHVDNTGLIAFYRLEDEGTTAFNQIPSGTDDYNGTIVNAPTKQTSTP